MTDVQTHPYDALSLSQALIRQPSETPDTGAGLRVLADMLSDIGFACEIITFEDEGTPAVANLYARYGSEAPLFGFAGHTDVVPAGQLQSWQKDPYAADISDGQLWGRGAADMKAAIAAFAIAARDHIQAGTFKGSICFVITGDEEGPAINGTVKLLNWMQARGEVMDMCLVGEPTNPLELGEMLKIGRRGSLHGYVTALGTQGHVAYPERAHNPIPDLMKLIDVLISTPLDAGNDHFQPSNLEVTDLSVGNDTTNIIPAEAKARFNVRFSSEYGPDSLKAELIRRMNSTGVKYQVDWVVSGDSFLTQPGPLSDAIVAAVAKHTGRTPKLSTTGGTSDARFIKNMCPVVEFGLVGQTMHKVDEHVAVADIHTLKEIYSDVLAALLPHT